MRVLLLSGLGPYFLNEMGLEKTLLAAEPPADLQEAYARLAGRPVRLRDLTWRGRPVFRPYRGSMPHLPTETVRSILTAAGIDHEVYDLEGVWRDREGPTGRFDVVGLSTTFICETESLRVAMKWIARRFPDAILVLGGQFSNLKYASIMEAWPQVQYVVRGDAEAAFPALVRALEGRGSLDDVPNLVVRGREVPCTSYIDMEAHPSPAFSGRYEIVPYESMRGCPFVCRYCSFPAASPKWRYKSAEKIAADWAGYVERNGARLVRAQDSTFTVPPTRLRRLMDLLPSVGVPWEAYTRANSIDTPEMVERLEASHCRALQIGLESMDPAVLKMMDKRVSALQNERAVELLAGSPIQLRAYFMVGYPGETPEHYQQTHEYLVERFQGRFSLHAFMPVDETMPVWEDAERLQMEVVDNGNWRHVGMDSVTAYRLRKKTLRETRWKNDRAVLRQWHLQFENPLVPELDPRANLRLEKAIERLAWLIGDLGADEAAAARCRALLEEIEGLGLRFEPLAA